LARAEEKNLNRRGTRKVKKEFMGVKETAISDVKPG
jgi:hypothetical protein